MWRSSRPSATKSLCGTGAAFNAHRCALKTVGGRNSRYAWSRGEGHLLLSRPLFHPRALGNRHKKAAGREACRQRGFEILWG
jgi:hypothetical protein